MNKYNWQTVGHKKIVEFLQKNIDNNKLAHAYLLAGQGKLGKKLLADKFIMSILCNDYNLKNSLQPANLPCGNCVFCNQLKKRLHPDVYFLTKDEEKKNISVGQVREMQKFLQMGSFLNSYKIALIDNAEELSESAQNSLLKILEEPTPKTILILLIDDYHLLLPTIVSRCQLVKFYPLSLDDIYNHLVGLGADRDQAKLLAALSRGQIGKAIELYENQEYFKEYINKTNKFLALFEVNIAEKFAILEKEFQAFKNPQELIDFWQDELDDWQLIIRDMILLKNKIDYLVVNLYFKDQLIKIGVNYSIDKLRLMLLDTQKIKKILNYNINPRLAVENLILNF